ncbi:MAG TPA: hypothetical protein VMG37_07390 [Solirubrobacteraceae bacterium]|nr:hypothetical protein [Solirubrobacteraceae bacterium]
MNDTALALEDAVATAATGDIWPLHGRSIADLTIRALTNSPVNHVGMAVAIDDPPPQLWHAEFDRSLPDVWTGERHRGVQRRDAGRQNPSVGRRLSPCDKSAAAHCVGRTLLIRHRVAGVWPFALARDDLQE